MNHRTLLLSLFVALLLSSCSRYNADLSYSQKIQAQVANKNLSPVTEITPVAAKNAAILQEQHSLPEVATVSSPAHSRRIAHNLRKVSHMLPLIAGIPVQLIERQHKAIMQVKNTEHTADASTSFNVFLMMLSLFVMVGGAILMYVGFSQSLTMITVAGIVVLAAAIFLMGVTAARLIALNSKP